VARHYAMMQYHLGWLDASLSPVAAPTGKRIRPMLCLLACASAGGDPRAALPAAAGLELLHNFSLIHDDIEDNSVTRRHRPTAWKAFGMPLACNAGDGMFSLAHVAFQRLREHDLPLAVVLDALRCFDETCVALTEGQFLDMSYEARPTISVEEYDRMIAGKTGALLAASTEIGALIGGAPSDQVSVYRCYGAALGRAFQLQDDVLGIWGDETVTGKSAASDILSKKKSLPVIYALADRRVGSELAKLYAAPVMPASAVGHVLELLATADARARVEAQVREASTEARRALETIQSRAAPAAFAALVTLLDVLMARSS
jgi:geranylgeranyl diphosphate synthase type I